MPKLSPITQDLILRSKAYQQGMADANKKLKRFQGGSKRASASAAKLGRTIKQLGGIALGAAGIGGMAGLATSAMATANAVDRASKRLGLSTSEFQDFTNAAKAADIQVNVAEMGLQRFTRRLGEAQQGGGELLGTLEKYGVQLRDSNGEARTASAVLGDLSEVIKNAESPAERLRIAFKAFDSEGADLVRILSQGKTGLEEFVATGNREFGKFESGTIASLSRADAAIRAFKSRATIRVGELIAGEADGAAIKELGLRLMAVAGKFGGSLIDHLAALGNIIQAGIGGSFKFVATAFGDLLVGAVIRFRTALLEALQAAAEKGGVLVPGGLKNKLTVELIKARKAEADYRLMRSEKEQKGWKDFFNESITDQTNLSQEFETFWSDKADEQRSLLTAAQKASDAAKDAGKTLGEVLGTEGGESGVSTGPESNLSSGNPAAAMASGEKGSSVPFIGRQDGERLGDFFRRVEREKWRAEVAQRTDPIKSTFSSGNGGQSALGGTIGGMGMAGDGNSILERMLEQLKIIQEELTKG